jgi:hypothetical protein
MLIVDMDPFYSTYTGIKRDGTAVYLLEGDWNESEGLEKMSQELKLAHDESDVEYNKFLGKVGFKRLDTGVAIPCIVVPKYWNPEEDADQVCYMICINCIILLLILFIIVKGSLDY